MSTSSNSFVGLIEVGNFSGDSAQNQGSVVSFSDPSADVPGAGEIARMIEGPTSGRRGRAKTSSPTLPARKITADVDRLAEELTAEYEIIKFRLAAAKRAC